MKQWYSIDFKQVFTELKTGINGLTAEEAAARLQSSGENKLDATNERSRFSIFISQFKDLMIVILAAAAIISFVVGEHTDAYVILIIIIGNAVIGYVQEYNAEQSIRMLQKMSAQHTIVLRQGKPSDIDATQLVPGDVILLEAGNIVPADARLIQVHALRTEEAALTGESHAVDKHTDIVDKADLMAADQLNMVFKGTIVSNGSGKAVVVSTGMQTEMGKIARMLQGASEKTPLQKRLAVFSKQLAYIVIGICVVVFGYGILRGEPALNMFLTALSLAVAALPEALPAVITIALARGAARMVKQHALVRRLPAVETLGSVTYICSDKTGTLTLNKMKVEKQFALEGKEDLLLYAMLLNNEVKTNDKGELIGDSTEIALVAYAEDKGIDRASENDKYKTADKLPFDSDRMRMSTLHSFDGRWLLLVKGAPATVADVLSSKHTNEKESWLEMNREWAAKGMRVLFFAYRFFDEKPTMDIALENDLDMLGITGMIDPPRVEVVDAINECKIAGIKTVMITGDQKITAIAIARELQIMDDGDDDSQVLTGMDIKKMDEKELAGRVLHTRVYARVSPEQKLNIVKALQDNGQSVSMTGDGVNDAPSLKQADIGVAMGITGTDVAKEAAHMILLDDNFATIVKAVKEGRRIYDNIRKFILYVLSCNLGEILVIFFAPVLGLPIPLLPIHILWINLVTDGLPGLALATEPEEKDIMKRPPNPANENLFTGSLVKKIVTTGSVLAIAALGVEYWALSNGYDKATQQTMVFSVLCFTQLCNAISVRSSTRSVFSINLFSNPALIGSVLFTVFLQLLLIYLPVTHNIFKTVSLRTEDILIVVGVSLVSFMLIEMMKLFYKENR